MYPRSRVYVCTCTSVLFTGREKLGLLLVVHEMECSSCSYFFASVFIQKIRRK